MITESRGETRNLKPFLLACTIVTLFAVFPLVTKVSSYTLSLLIMLFNFVVLSQSYNLMGGYAGQFNLGLSAYFGSGALAYNIIYSASSSFFLSFIGCCLVAAALAVIVGFPTLRFKGVYFATGTLALAEALRITVNNVLPMSIYPPSNYLANFSLVKAYSLNLLFAVLAVAATYFLIRTKIGLALRAIRDDDTAAEAIGINLTKYKLLVFVVSSVAAGAAGAGFSYFRGILHPVDQFSPHWTFGPLMAASIGGSGTITGPIWGSLFFVILQELFSRTLGQAHFIITGVVFVLVILFLPGGMIEAGDKSRRFVVKLVGKVQGTSRP